MGTLLNVNERGAQVLCHGVKLPHCRLVREPRREDAVVRGGGGRPGTTARRRRRAAGKPFSRVENTSLINITVTVHISIGFHRFITAVIGMSALSFLRESAPLPGTYIVACCACAVPRRCRASPAAQGPSSAPASASPARSSSSGCRWRFVRLHYRHGALLNDLLSIADPPKALGHRLQQRLSSLPGK